MIRVKNRKVITLLSQKSLKAKQLRNRVAIFAISLTTLLFMALFMIAGTMVYSFQQESFRQVGGDMHGTFKNLTLEEKETLEKDSRIVRSGGRLMLGTLCGDAFRKVHAELSYMDDTCMKSYFCTPEHGTVPTEGTKEIACDTRILKCLGVKPQIGANVTVTYEIGGSSDMVQLTDQFQLCGWWEYDPACNASMAILPRSYVEAAASSHPRQEGDNTNYTGTWDLNVFFNNSLHIQENLLNILADNGYQAEYGQAGHYINIGVNWAYSGAQLAAHIDPEMIAGVALMAVLIILTGYLAIFNIFQISISKDIRFYGLLKTIGTTKKQIRRIVRRQALLLSAIGIPAGLAAGALAGMLLAPALLSFTSVQKTYLYIRLWPFAAAAAFSLATVLFSCAKPGRAAAKISPVEAVRYTDASPGKARKKKRKKRGRSGGKIVWMAWAYLGRNKKKTFLTVVSMSLAVVLLQETYMGVCGFDMDAYLNRWVASDFILGDAAYFQTSMSRFLSQPILPKADVQAVQMQGKVLEGGCVYGHAGRIMEYVEEDVCRQQFQRLGVPPEEMDGLIKEQERNSAGKIAMNAQIYGMEAFPLNQLQVLDGDLADVYQPKEHAIAAVYGTDDYGQVIDETQWAKVGDTVTLHYIYDWDYIDSETGEKIPEEEIEAYGRDFTTRIKEYKDITYNVVACVAIKNAMSYRYGGSHEFVLNADVFQRDSRTSDIMAYLFNTEKENQELMQHYLQTYTETDNPALDFESKQSYEQHFYQFRNSFLLLGGLLCFIIAIVGILNFFHTILTSIDSRRMEFAMMQSIGMTGRQLKQMLIYEGLFYGAAAVILAFFLSFLLKPVAEHVIGSIAWFFNYRFSAAPILLIVPVFAAFGIVLPLLVYRQLSRQTIVERLRENG